MSDEYPLMAFIANEGVAPKGERYDRSALVNDTASKLYKKTKFGDFIYSSNNLETGSIGLNKYGKASISPVYSIFKPTGIADSDFLGRRLIRKDFINEMVKWRQGVIYGQWRIHESDFIKIEVTVPTVEEQYKLGLLLDNLDTLITLHQRKLEKLVQIRKAFAERCFLQSRKEFVMAFTKEADFEEAVVKLLIERGWKDGVLKNYTEQQLIQNWANILFENNRGIDRLNDYPLTDGEMQQIMEQVMNAKTPMKLNKFINGKSVLIKRDNPDDKLNFGKEVSLKIYDRLEIAAGLSRYQIAEQPKFPTKSKILNDRRGDLMLLINGMPVIHIELKRSGNSVAEACRQIEKYAAEGILRDCSRWCRFLWP